MSTEAISAPPRTAPWVTAGLAMPMLLSAMGGSIANIALPSLLTAFSASVAEVQWVIIAYLLATTVAIVPAGYLGDRFGRGPVLLAGLAVFTAASLACAFAPTLMALIAARAVQGLGAAVLSTLTLSLMRDVSASQTLGASMGVLGSMSAIGTTLGPLAGGMVVSAFGWPAAFLLLAPPGVLSLILVTRIAPARTAGMANAGKPDVMGIALLTIILTSAALALGRSTVLPASWSWMLALLAVLGAAVFVMVESRAAAPVVRLAMLRNPALASSLMSNVLVAAIMMTTLVIGPVFLTSGLGLGAAAVGFVMSAGPAASMASGVVAGRLADRFGTRRIVLAGLAQMIAGGLALALLPPVLGVAGYVVAVLVLTPGYQLFLAANNAGVMAQAPAEHRGQISGLLNLSRNLGFTVGASGMGAVFAMALAAASGPSAPAMIDAASLTYLAAAGLAALAFVIMAFGQRIRSV